MKYAFFLNIILLSTISNLFGQVNLTQVTANISSDASTASITFTTQNNFVNSGESSNIKVFLRMPAAQTSASTMVSISSTFPFILVQNVVSGANRNMVFQANFPGGFDLSQWMPNQTYDVGDFTFSNFTGALNVEMFSISNLGSTWNGTSMTKLANGGVADNLVSWPISQTVVLPIKVKSFSAIIEGERASRLDWVTSSEVNSDYFGVERSADGNTWEQIGEVAAAGNSNTDLAYQYIDRKLPSFRAGENIFYYRLRLTDLDGQYKYTDVRGVNFGKTSNSIVSIYPNPTTEIINVDISGMSLDAGDVTLSVFDMNGRNMISKNILGNGIELIDVDQYPAGTYNVVVQQGETIQQKKIIKID